jgi:hypothetical protein
VTELPFKISLLDVGIPAGIIGYALEGMGLKRPELFKMVDKYLKVYPASILRTGCSLFNLFSLYLY